MAYVLQIVCTGCGLLTQHTTTKWLDQSERTEGAAYFTQCATCGGSTEHQLYKDAQRIWGLDDRKGFGRDYRKESTIRELIDEDNEHIRWLLDNVDFFLLDNEAYQYYQDSINRFGYYSS